MGRQADDRRQSVRTWTNITLSAILLVGDTWVALGLGCLVQVKKEWGGFREWGFGGGGVGEGGWGGG